METSQRNLLSLALEQKLIGTIIDADEGQFKILDFIDYDSMTRQFTLQVQNLTTLEVSVREMSDKLKYTVEYPKRSKPNASRLNPKRK